MPPTSPTLSGSPEMSQGYNPHRHIGAMACESKGEKNISGQAAAARAMKILACMGVSACAPSSFGSFFLAIADPLLNNLFLQQRLALTGLRFVEAHLRITIHGAAADTEHNPHSRDGSQRITEHENT